MQICQSQILANFLSERAAVVGEEGVANLDVIGLCEVFAALFISGKFTFSCQVKL